MLIVEGPDGAGKTTLLKEVQERLGVDIAPRVVSKDAEAMVDLREWVEDNLNRGFQNLLFDRHRLISETIYGPILRTEQQPGFTDLEWIGRSLSRFYRIRPIILYCLPPLETVKANVTDDEDNRAVAEFIEPIYAAYASRIALDAMLNPLGGVWDYTKGDKFNFDILEFAFNERLNNG